MILIIMLCFAISNFCFSADDKNFLENVTKKMVQRLTKSATATDIKYNNVYDYLTKGREVILKMLRKAPLVSPANEKLQKRIYEYEASSIKMFQKSENKSDNVARARIQIFEKERIAFFWRSKILSHAYFMDNLRFNNWECLDISVSPDEKYIACITKNGKLSVRDKLNLRLKPIEHSIILQGSKKGTQAGFATIKTMETGVVIWGKSWAPEYTLYCALGQKIHIYAFDAAKKQQFTLITDISPEGDVTVTDLALLQHEYENKVLLAATCVAPSKKEYIVHYYELDYKIPEAIVTAINPPVEALGIKDLRAVLLIYAGRENHGVRTVSFRDVAVQRGLENVKGYLAININTEQNLVALLNATSQSSDYYAPQVELAPFIPTTIELLIQKFNKTVLEDIIDMQQAQNIFVEIMSLYTTLYPGETAEKEPQKVVSPAEFVVYEKERVHQQGIAPYNVAAEPTVPISTAVLAAYVGIEKSNTTAQPQSTINTQASAVTSAQNTQPSIVSVQQAAPVGPTIKPTSVPQVTKPLTTRIYENAAWLGNVIQKGFAWMGRRFASLFGFSIQW